MHEKRRHDLDESDFIRDRLSDEGKSAWRRYSMLVLGRESLAALLLFELKMLLLAGIPGALGLVLRKKFFPSLFGSCGRNVVFGRDLRIRNAHRIHIGDDVTIDDNTLLDGRGANDRGVCIGDSVIIGAGVTINSKVGDIVIGSNCNIGSLSTITSQGGIEIGDWCQIAGGCKISGGRFQLEPQLYNGRPFSRFTMGPIVIGHTTFLGGNVSVTDACVIGCCCVVGTGSVVMSDIKPFSVYMPRPGMIMGKTGDPSEGPALESS